MRCIKPERGHRVSATSAPSPPGGTPVGWHWQLSWHGSDPFGTAATDPAQLQGSPCGKPHTVGVTQGVRSNPWISFQGYREPRTGQVPGKSCSASQAVCHPARRWGPHLGYTWNLVFHKHQISLDLQLPGRLAGSCWLRDEPLNSLSASEGVSAAEERTVWMIDQSSLI